MKSNQRQYTIRNIPDRVDRVLKKRARETGKSFNQTALEALIEGAGEDARQVKRDFSYIIGSLSEAEAERMEEEISAQRRVDPELWK
jgi:hypothetical protein